MTRSTDQVYAGFIPLTDSAPLIVAREVGFAADEGLDLVLVKETTWATIRDRLAVGHLDIAHALAPMPIAANLGLNPLPHEMIAPIALGYGGNTVTVSQPLWSELEAAGAPTDFSAKAGLDALSRVVENRRASGQRKLVFGIVHPHSAHHYELAYWLAVGGIMPGRDAELVVLPPPLMPAALTSGRIDGFCAGEPWGSVAVADMVGRILTTKAHIWRASPEKVVAVNKTFADADAERHAALLRAIYRACVWCDDPANRNLLSELLAQPDYLGLPVEIIGQGLARELPTPDGGRRVVEGFLNFSAHAATFPWVSHCLWFYTQMVRWKQCTFAAEDLATVRATYRPDLYRAALKPLGIPIPGANAKVEGALTAETPVGSRTGRLTLSSDGFFDGRTFDPDAIEEYIAALDVISKGVASSGEAR